MKKLIILLLAVVLLASCGNNQSKEDSSSKKVTLTAAGATFPMPFYNLAFKKYTKETGLLLTYGGIGSGGGIRSLKDQVVDFGATDAFLSDEDLKEMTFNAIHIPTCIGAVVIAYNLPGIDEIKLSDQLLEDIFMGKVTNWNDSKIKKANPDVELPDTKITVVHRSDGSGTTFIFSDYMSKISTEWNEQVGRGKSLQWPTGLGAKGNPGVAGTISQTEGAVGYIGSEYAFAQKISYALVQNQAGNYIKPTIESISASAQGAIPADTRVMLTNSSDPNAYPISGFTWVILYGEQAYNGRTKAQATETAKFLQWLISPEAQSVAQSVNYAPLPAKAVELSTEILKSITYEGQPLLN
ncbi:MAG: phosphate ABC transporter substrate-binding protein PstS [Marinilabiliales bacterium]|nr:MAG: phosphate ABC transporter substrate-binding protein PstS [Marinilabiliales bacterium]